MNEKELFRLKSQIDEARTKTSELRGRHQFLMQELERQWHCKTVKQGEAHLAELKAEAAKLELRKNAGIIKLQEELGK